MPRMTPRRDTEQLACATSSWCPTSPENSPARNSSAKLPLSSEWMRGAKTQAPGMPSGSMCGSSLVAVDNSTHGRREHGDFPVGPAGAATVARAFWTIRTRGSSGHPVSADSPRRNDTPRRKRRMPKPLDAESPLFPRLHQAMRSVARRTQPSGYHEAETRPDHGETPRRPHLTIGNLALLLFAVGAAAVGQVMLKHGMKIATARA